jgi:hypothetical protein
MARDRAAKSAYDKARYPSVREKKVASAKAWYQDHKAEKRDYDVAYRPVKNAKRRQEYAKNPEKVLAPQRGLVNRAKNLRRYGLTPAQFDARFESQGRRCACCGSVTPRGNNDWCIDHDHNTNVIRGIICGLCNTGIGHLGDDLAGIANADSYLRRHHGLSVELVDEHY